MCVPGYSVKAKKKVHPRLPRRTPQNSLGSHRSHNAFLLVATAAGSKEYLSIYTYFARECLASGKPPVVLQDGELGINAGNIKQIRINYWFDLSER